MPPTALLRRLGPAAVAAALLGGLGAGPASAATVFVQGPNVVFQAGPGEINQVYVTNFDNPYGTDSISFRDGAGVPAAGDGCELAQGALSGYVHCRSVGGKALIANLGDRNDTWSMGYALGPVVVNGEDGDDVLGGGPGNDTINGGPGGDRLSGDEYYVGFTDQGGFDQHGGDTFNGGDGGDLVSYYNHENPTPVTATLDDQPNDGESGEGDDIRSDVEGIEGPLFSTARLTGNEQDNSLYGTGGQDILVGNGGNDTLSASDGSDTVDGGAGDDALEGGAGDDTITGGPGTDSFVGDGTGGTQQVISGNDRLFAKDGVAEDISCGPGADTVQNDPIDKLVNDGQNACETTDPLTGAPKPPGPGLPGGGTTPGATGPKLTAAGRTLKLSGVLKSGLKATVTCPAACKIKLRLGVGAKTAKRYRLPATLARASRTSLKATTAKLTLKLSKKVRSRLRKARSVPMTLVAEVTGGDGQTVLLRRTVTLKR